MKTVTSNLNITIMPRPLQEKYEALLFLKFTLNVDNCCRILSTRGILKKEGLKFEHDTCKTSYAILLKTQMVQNLAWFGCAFTNSSRNLGQIWLCWCDYL